MLAPLYQQLARQAVLNVKAAHVASFLGHKITPQLAQEIGSRFATRIEGTCIRHRFGKSADQDVRQVHACPASGDHHQRRLRLQAPPQRYITPFKWTKQVASHFGGTRQGLAISWPARIKDVGGIRTQFHHVIDIVPTILEVTGIKAPDFVSGIKQKPIEGVSMAYTFDRANADAPSPHKIQYFEMASNRGIYSDGWYANTTPPVSPWELKAPTIPFTEYKWELYNLKEDYSQFNDLSAKLPDKLKEMRALFAREAAKYGVFPLDNQAFARASRASTEHGRGQDGIHLHRREHRDPDRHGPEHPQPVIHDYRRGRCPAERRQRNDRYRRGALGRYGLYMLKGRPVFTYNLLELLIARWANDGDPPLPAGQAYDHLRLQVRRPRSREGDTGVLRVDGRELRALQIPKTIPLPIPVDETFDIGDDAHGGRRSPLPGAVPVQRHDRQAHL
jgi:arylsulfatase